ncbi:FkbM family methyltransferase [Sphingomonas sp.]|jgi:FkbM family methyltransferase|uniref:FkbM family methyltransferase n=1 Tax=Sphingomonas sp. TaxID=28214 RepID=UPI002D8104A5|nr:FkbM family methyltransferase [Sphingomonas sp.]HEU0043736.1 FkbM family methyltransferase [Sphingomonas sp.]
MAALFRRVSNKAQRMLGVQIERRTSPLQATWKALLLAKSSRGIESDEESFVALCKANFAQSHSQLFQDIFVLFELGKIREGYFVEFGATDGDYLSNTHLLEYEYGWRGILAEPARAWHESLRRNRNCAVETRCVTASSNETVTFNQTDWLEISTIDKLSASDMHAAQRVNGKRYQVDTISLNDLLAENDAPPGFDYLSVDTEGSELDILSAFDLQRYRPSVITVEHNYTSNRKRIYDLLTGNGYARKFERLSLFDDWYVRA